MNEDAQHIHEPNPKPTPRAIPDIREILARCYKEGMSPEQAFAESQSYGVNNLGANDVEAIYRDLANLATWLGEKLVPYLKEKEREPS